MSLLELEEYDHLDSKGLYEFLLSQKTTKFKIKVYKGSDPPPYSDTNDRNYNVFMEYLTLGYFGQKLSELATSYSYYVPDVNAAGLFIFEVDVTDLEKLAGLLWDLINVRITCNDIALATEFQNTAWDFLIDVHNGEIFTSTWGLLFIADEHYPENDEIEN